MAEDWLDKLKVGDVVIVGGNDSSGGFPVRVARLTPSQIITENGKRFRKKDGRRIGQGPYGEQLNQPTKERWERIKCRRIRIKLRQFNWGELPLEVLLRIDRLLPFKVDA